MPFEIIQEELVNMKVDAIVNAANTNQRRGQSIWNTVFLAAGIENIRKDCDLLGTCDVGEVVITSGYNLSAKYIIHTVGPIWMGGGYKEEKYLRACYENALKLAQKNGLSSIAFPLISTGIYDYPKHLAIATAKEAITNFLSENDMQVYLVVTDRRLFEIDNSIIESVQEYLDLNFIDENFLELESVCDIAVDEKKECHHRRKLNKVFQESVRSIDDVVDKLDETFSEKLLGLIDERGITDVEAYKRANVDRKLFSKIRGDKHYRPSKNTVIAFAIALKLNVHEAEDLLKRAGYALSKSSKFDVIIEFFLEEENYDIFKINEALFAFGQPVLSA